MVLTVKLNKKNREILYRIMIHISLEIYITYIVSRLK